MIRLLAIGLFSGVLCAQSVSDGVAAIDAGHLEDAVHTFSTLAEQTPNCFECQFYLGLAQFRAGRPAVARPALEKAVALMPADANAWKLLGLATTSAGDLDAAITAFRKACDLAPKDEEACYYLARNLYAQGHYESASASFDMALQAAPAAMLPKVHRAIALNFAALGQSEEAERHFVKAIQSAGRASRDVEDPRVDYGAFLFRQGRTDAALAPLQEAVKDSPASPRANLELGRVLLHLDKTEAAVASLEKAVKFAPSDSNAHLLLGRAYLKLGKTAEGERELRLGEQAWSAKPR